MKFDYECDVPDGLVLIDEYYFNEFNSDILYSFEILLDSKGETELIYDFPNEKWESVRARETVLIKDFCNSGKMVVFLSDKDINDGEIKFDNKESDTDIFLNVPSGKLILVNASELIQCMAYPDLEMEKILELHDVGKGTYAIENEGIRKIVCNKSNTTKTTFDNIIKL